MSLKRYPINCSPFRFQGAWSGEFKPYNIGRDPDVDGNVCRRVCMEDPRLRTPAPLSPDPLVY